MNIFQRMANLWRIAGTYDAEMEFMRGAARGYEARIDEKIDFLHKRIGEHTTVHMDVHPKNSHHQVIVIGKWADRDYVRAFDVRQEDLQGLIDLLKRMEPHSKLGRMDTVYGADVSAVYLRERWDRS